MQSSPRIEELRQKFHENPRRYFAPLANEYRKAGDPEQAIAICRAHLAQQPGHMSGHVVYGQALYDAWRMDEAGIVFQQALALDPENVIVLRHLGDIARQRGDVEEARSWYSRALDGDPYDAEVAAYLAELTEPLVAAVSETEIAIPGAAAADSPLRPDANPYLDVAESSVDSNGQGAATEEESFREETERRAIPAEESSPIITRTLAELYLQQGHIEPALEIYRQLAEREPQDALIRERIDEISGEGTTEDAVSTESLATPTADADAEPLTDEEPGAVADAALAESDRAIAAGLMEEAAGAGEVGERGTNVLASESGLAIPSGEHLSETERSAELWDTADSWGTDLLAENTDEFFGLPVDVGGMAMEEAAAGESPIDDDLAEEEGGAEAKATDSEDAGGSVTVREFFATLGSMRPPYREVGQVAGLPSPSEQSAAEAGPDASGAANAADYVFADDAFASLFADIPPNAEDSQAAAALSGAVAHAASFSTPEASAGGPLPRTAATEASVGSANESEEDIRRFREWLDGLAES